MRKDKALKHLLLYRSNGLLLITENEGNPAPIRLFQSNLLPVPYNSGKNYKASHCVGPVLHQHVQCLFKCGTCQVRVTALLFVRFFQRCENGLRDIREDGLVA